ncbi:MAG: hypothetical protein NZ873_02855, partial [Crenarchaeota archaeon]|nr:hypothetical protein [Thermoproteota archaeon]MDW8034601.1 hypothetical protein [Nitrososphaerota archaeon]
VIQISYSLSKKIWSGGTGYLRIKAEGPGFYSDTKTATAIIDVPQGSQAIVYVCGDDRFPLPGGWFVEDKYLALSVDGREVYRLGRNDWFSNCYSRAATIGFGTHRIELKIHISVRVSSNVREERDIAYAAMDIMIENSGFIQAQSHSAQATIDGEVTHVFSFQLPKISIIDKIDWRAVWKGVEKRGSGTPGSIQQASFKGVNKDSWVFTSPVVIELGGLVPSVQPTEGYSIDAVYHEGSEDVGVRRIAVAINNGEDVGFTSGKYLVTKIEYLGFYSTGCTQVDGLDAWANSGSKVNWSQRIRFYDENGWVSEEAVKGVETGSCSVKKIGGGLFSKKIYFLSKNRRDEIKLTINLPHITLHFDSMKAEPAGPTDLGLRRVGEMVELKVKTSDCLGEYSRLDVYRVSEKAPGIKSYTYAPVAGVYRGITSTIGGNVTFTIQWVSFRLAISSVSGAVLRDGVYWTKSGSKVTVSISASFSDDRGPVKNVRIRDSEGRELLTGSDGVASFSYVKNDCEIYLSYIAVDDNGNPLSNEVGLRIVFSRILVEIVNCEGILFKEAYYGCNDDYVSVSVRTVYSHNNAPVSGAKVLFKPSGSSAFTDSKGSAVLKIVGRNKAYEGLVEASDSIIDGNTNLKIVFTNVILEASKNLFYGAPGEEFDITILARLTFDGTLLNGVRVKWVEENIVNETPASFRLKIPEQGHLKASFEALDFLPCVKPCEIVLSPKAIKFGGLDEKGPTIINNGFHSRKYFQDFFLNIMDLLNLTIPKVVWYNNGSIAYGVKIGVVSSNGTVIRIGTVSDKGVSFNWTESKPGIYHYVLKPLDSNIWGDVLNVKAVFTAFNITGEYILDLNNGTHTLIAKAYWAHNCSPAKSLPVHTMLSKKRAISDMNGIIRVVLNDSDYNNSCFEEVTVFKTDRHPSGIWRTVGKCQVKIVKLELEGFNVRGDQYGLTILANLTDTNYSIPFGIKIEGYPPELYSSIRILGIKSDNSSLTIFIRPTKNISFKEILALRMEDFEYDGANIRAIIRSLSNNLTVRNVKIRILGSKFEKVIGDLQPNTYYEITLEVPDEHRTNPIVLAACSDNTMPHVVKIWKRQGISFLTPVSIIPLLIALVIRLKNA